MNLQDKELKEIAVFLSIALLITLVFSFMLFRATGIRVVLGIVFVSFPCYAVLNNFKLAEAEKFIFSIMLGLTIFPSLAYLLGLLMSFKIAIVAAFAVFIGISVTLKKHLYSRAKIIEQLLPVRNK